MAKLVSLIIPVYNEQANIAPLLERLTKTLQDTPYEILFVSDGSTDGTDDEIKAHMKSNKHLKLVSFTRNFGHQSALTCGYDLVKGDAVITMDADLQDPPELIPEMIDLWKNGAKIVYAKRNKRDGDNVFKKVTAGLFYKLLNFVSDTPVPQDVGDYRLLDRSIVSFINHLPEQSRFLRGLVAWGGFAISYVYFDRPKRHAGTTHYPLTRMLDLALDGITAFSTKPLRMASYIGFLSATVGFLGIVYAVVGRVLLPNYWVTGWTALFVGIMFLGGVQLITIGIIGEYIGRIYREVQRRPQYVVKEMTNV